MTRFKRPLLYLATLSLLLGFALCQASAPFKVFMIASPNSDHMVSSLRAKDAMIEMGKANNFTVDFTLDTSIINDATLAKYQVFLQMHLAPFEFSLSAQKALEKFVGQKKGWVGIHAVGLVQPDWQPGNVPYWKWYEDFFGGIKYVTHPALQKGTLKIEDQTHPAMLRLPTSFQLLDEWYEFSGNPRPNVHVLAVADEKTYTQVKPAGDHPLVWTNQKFARMIYIGVGHDSSDWSNTNYLNMVHDAVAWAATSDSTTTISSQKNTQRLGTKLLVAWIEAGRIRFGLCKGYNSIWDTRGHRLSKPALVLP
jgi:uncharacterized protein